MPANGQVTRGFPAGRVPLAGLLVASACAWAVVAATPVARADTPDGCQAWGEGRQASATCDASVGGEYRVEANCRAFNAGSKIPFGYVLPFNDRQYGDWQPAGSGQESTARCDGGYYLSGSLVQLRP